MDIQVVFLWVANFKIIHIKQLQSLCYYFFGISKTFLRTKGCFTMENLDMSTEYDKFACKKLEYCNST